MIQVLGPWFFMEYMLYIASLIERETAIMQDMAHCSGVVAIQYSVAGDAITVH